MMNEFDLLLIEDNPGDARLIQETLHRAGGAPFRLHVAHRLDTGLAALDASPVQLILLDLSLPDSHGLETVMRVRAHAPHTPIVVLTGLDDESLALKSLELGAQDYLVKGSLDGRLLGRTIRYAIERQRSEQALRLSEARFRGLLEAAPDAVFVVDGAGRIAFANAQAEALFGYSAGRLLGESIERLVPEHARERHAELRERFMAAPRVRAGDPHMELSCRRMDGTEFPADIRLGPLEQSDDVSVLCVVRDISERKAAEQALAAKTAEIEAMSRQLWQAAKLATMGELAASIAHELNNPLATVSLHIESLAAELAAAGPHGRTLAIMEQEVDRMATLVANLLAFSRRGMTAITTVDLSQEIENTLDLLHYQVRQHQITIVRDASAGRVLVHADRQQLRQLFLNVCTNAIDAMPGGGSLAIQVEPLEDRVCIDITDTGAGIAAEDLPRLMEPFFTTKPEGKGTGLGLSICRRILQEHDGSLEITSAGRGLGTRVRLALPTAGPARCGPAAEEEDLE